MQAVLVKMGGWVTCMSYAASSRVGDFGTLYAADVAAAIVKINPCIVDGPNVWKESSQVQWKLTGTARDPKLNTPLAFRWGKGGHSSVGSGPAVLYWRCFASLQVQ